MLRRTIVCCVAVAHQATGLSFQCSSHNQDLLGFMDRRTPVPEDVCMCTIYTVQCCPSPSHYSASNGCSLHMWFGYSHYRIETNLFKSDGVLHDHSFMDSATIVHELIDRRSILWLQQNVQKDVSILHFCVKYLRITKNMLTFLFQLEGHFRAIWAHYTMTT